AMSPAIPSTTWWRCAMAAGGGSRTRTARPTELPRHATMRRPADGGRGQKAAATDRKEDMTSRKEGAATGDIVIAAGYVPGIVGRGVAMHMRYYHAAAG